MVKKIMRDPLFLAQKSTDATEADRQVITDLLDTLRANLDHCVGMAANMIGVKKNIIVVAAGPFQFAMVIRLLQRRPEHFRQKKDAYLWKGCVRVQDIKKLKWIFWMQISRSSMANIPVGLHRSSNTK
mgnify:CR=1 FL=1